MPTRLVVEDVARYTIHQTYGGREVDNVIDVRIEVGGGGRDAIVEDQAGLILNAWHDQMRLSQVNDITADSVSWVDLTSEDGSVGEISATAAHTWPAAGAGSGDPMPGNVSALYTKVLSTGGRSRRNGRLYLCALSEAFTPSTGPNLIDPTTLATLTARGGAFLSAVNATVGTEGWDSHLAVVHILTRDDDGHPATGDSIDVSDMVCQPVLATQRRRLRD